MHNSNAHIVNTIHWSTSIDERELAGKLQEKISNWTNFHFERESGRILDRICSDEQCWRIPYLELDLGEIDYSDLESEFSRRIPRLLEEKIQEYILQLQFFKVSGVKEESPGNNQELLESLLLKGVLPWWSESVALNTLVKERLSESERGFAALVQQLAKSVVVRKRLAWQLEETTLEAVVKAVKPVGFKEIIDFKVELQEVQETEHLVSSNKSEFKQGLWLWILNYLFEERGTIFNKVAYMHSLIGQMAAHYNLNREDLLSSIRLALERMALMHSRKNSFLPLLNQIAKFGTHQNNQSERDHWVELELILSSGSTNQRFYFEPNKVIRVLLHLDAQKLISRLKKGTGYEIKHLLKVLDYPLVVELLEAVSSMDQCFPALGYFTSVAEVLYTSSDQKSRGNLFKKILQHYFLSEELINAKHFTPAVFLSVPEQSELQRKLLLLQTRNMSNSIMLRLADDVLSFNFLDQSQSLVNPKEWIKTLLFSILNKAHPSEQEYFSLGVSLQKHPQEFFLVLQVWRDKAQFKKLFPFLIKTNWLPFFAEGSLLIKRLFKNLEGILSAGLSTTDSIQIERLNEVFLRHAIQELILDANLNIKDWLQKTSVSFIAAGEIWNDGFPQWLEQLNASPLFKQYQVECKQIEIKSFHELLQKRERQKKRLSEQSIFWIRKQGISLSHFKTLLLLLFGESQIKEVEQLYQNWQKHIQQGSNIAEKDRVRQSLMLCFADFHTHQGQFEKLNESIGFLVRQFSEQEMPVSKNRAAASIHTTLQNQPFGKAMKVVIEKNPEEFYHALLVLYQYFIELISAEKKELYNALFIQAAEAFHANTANSKSVADKLVSALFHFLTLELKLEAKDIVHSWNSRRLLGNLALQKVLKNRHQLFELLPQVREQDIHREVKHYHDLKLLEQVCLDMLSTSKVPSYAVAFRAHQVSIILKSVAEIYPLVLVNAIEKGALQKHRLECLVVHLPFANLIQLIQLTDSAKSAKLAALSQVFEGFRHLTSSKIRARQMQFFLYAYTLEIWKSNNWKRQTAKQFWLELVFEVSKKLALKHSVILEELSTIKYSLPLTYQTALDDLATAAAHKATKIGTKNLKPSSEMKMKAQVTKDYISINNAGIVLFNNYLSMLFERMGLIQEDKFKSEESRFRAINLLQYAATGSLKSEEYHLVLNKVLCGLHPEDPIPLVLKISTKEKEIVEGMIQAMIAHWPAIGESSVHGFRGNWVVREGMLSEEAEHWELAVEKRAYDLLLEKSPFSFSIIKYPWMDKSLKVKWPY